jgi:formate hydrogenlyase subunit 4
MMEMAAYIKLMVFVTIFINCFFPMGMTGTIGIVPIALSFIFYIMKVLVILGAISLIECSMAKFRLFRVPELLSAAFSLSLIAIVINFF